MPLNHQSECLSRKRLRKLHGLELRARGSSKVMWPVCIAARIGLLERVCRASRVRAGRRSAICRLEGVRQDATVLPEAVRRGNESASVICCSIPARACSTRGRTAPLSKFAYAQCAAAALAYLVLHQHDSVEPRDVRSGNPPTHSAEQQSDAAQAIAARDGRGDRRRARRAPARSFTIWPSDLAGAASS